MPKRSYEIKDFSVGTITNADLQDIPDGAASDSLNISSIGKLGAATPISEHIEIMGGMDEATSEMREQGMPVISNMLVRNGITNEEKNLALNIGNNFIYVENYRSDSKFADFIDIVSQGQMLIEDSEAIESTSVANDGNVYGAWQNDTFTDYNTRKVYFCVVETIPGYVYEVRANYITTNPLIAGVEESGYMIAVDANYGNDEIVTLPSDTLHVTNAYTTGSAGENGTWVKTLCDKQYFYSNSVKTFEFKAESNYSVVVLVSGNTHASPTQGDATPDVVTADSLQIQFSKGGYLWKELGADLSFTDSNKGLFIGSSTSVPHLLNKARDDDGLVLEYIEKSECAPIAGPTSMSNIDFMEVLYSYDTTAGTGVKYLVGGIKSEPYLWVMERGETTVGSGTIGYTNFIKSNPMTWATKGLGGIKFINGELGTTAGESKFWCWDFEGTNIYEGIMPDTNDIKYPGEFTIDLGNTIPLDLSEEGFIPEGAYIQDIVQLTSEGPIFILLNKVGGFSHGENVAVYSNYNGTSQYPIYTVQGGYHVTAYTGWKWGWGPGSLKWYHNDVNPTGGHDFYWTNDADTEAKPVAYEDGDYAALSVHPDHGYAPETHGGIKNMCWVNTTAADVKIQPTGGIGFQQIYDNGQWNAMPCFSVQPLGGTKFLNYSGKWQKAEQWPNNWPDWGATPDGWWTHVTEPQQLTVGAKMVMVYPKTGFFTITDDKYLNNNSAVDVLISCVAALSDFKGACIAYASDIATYKNKIQRPYPKLDISTVENYRTEYNDYGAGEIAIYYPWWYGDNSPPKSWGHKEGVSMTDYISIKWSNDNINAEGIRPEILNGWDKVFSFGTNLNYQNLLDSCRNPDDVAVSQSHAQALIDIMNNIAHVGPVACSEYHGGGDSVIGWSHFWTECSSGVTTLMPLPYGTQAASNTSRHFSNDISFDTSTWANGTGTADYAWSKEKRLNTNLYKAMNAAIAAWGAINTIASIETGAKSTAYSTYIAHKGIPENAFTANGFDKFLYSYDNSGAIVLDDGMVGALLENSTIKISKLIGPAVTTGSYVDNLENWQFDYQNIFSGEEGTFQYQEPEFLVTQSSSDGEITRTPTGSVAQITEMAICSHQSGSALTLIDTGVGGGDLQIIPATTAGFVIAAFTGDVIVRSFIEGSEDVQTSPFDSGDLRIGLTPSAGQEYVTVAETPTDEEEEEIEKLAYKVNDTVIYNMSFLYDGYQESPLMGSPVTIDVKSDTSYFAGWEDISLEVRLGSVNPRITAINVYRKKRHFEKYRLLEQIELDNYWAADEADGDGGGNISATAKMTSGISITIVDSGKAGISYEALTGMPEIVYQTMVDFPESEVVSNYLFAANATHPEVDNAERMIFRSQAGKFSMFNWAEDYIGLPEPVHTLKNAYSRLFAFSDSNMYQIDPYNLVLEHTFKGMGILKKQSVEVAGGILYIANKNGVYRYKNTQFQLITSPIQDIWTGIYDTHENSIPILSYDTTNDALLVMFGNKGTSSIDTSTDKALSYSISKNRWDKYKFPTRVTATCIDEDNNMLFAADSSEIVSYSATGEPLDDSDTVVEFPAAIYELFGSTVYKPIEWTTKEFTLGEDLRDKKFKKVKFKGNAVYIKNIWVDDTKVDWDVDSTDAEGVAYDTYLEEQDGTVRYVNVNKTGKKIKLQLCSTADAAQSEIFSLGITYSLKSVK